MFPFTFPDLFSYSLFLSKKNELEIRKEQDERAQLQQNQLWVTSDAHPAHHLQHRLFRTFRSHPVCLFCGLLLGFILTVVVTAVTSRGHLLSPLPRLSYPWYVSYSEETYF